MNNPFFSVLIPVYNVERYLSSCLESVLRQTFTDYEIVLINDGSKDSSGLICDDYVDRYPDKIRVQHKQNQGQISARRAGLKLANGRYICFLDSDDCWMDNTLSRLFDIIHTTNSDVVMFEWKRIDENGKELNATEQTLFPELGFIDKKTVFERMLSTSSLNSLCKKCCKSELFDVDVDYSNLYKIQNGEDMIQSLPVMYKANTFYYLNEALYLYRMNTTSITHVYRCGRYRAINVLRPLLYSYIEKLGLDTQENRVVFFTSYLRCIWDEVEAMYVGIPSREERIVALNELRSYEFVQRGKEYLGVCAISNQAHLGLSVFYRDNNMEMEAYMSLYLLAVKIYQGAKAACRKLLK